MNGYETIEDALTLGSGTERAFKCHVHGDRNPSASVNALTGLWICYSCGAKGKVGVENVEVSPDAVLRELSRVREMLEDDRHEVYPEAWLAQFDAAGPGDYWSSRFSMGACRAFRLGQDPKGDHATYPLRDATGSVLGVVKRNLVDPDGPKYRYPFGVDMSKLIFNYHAIKSDVIVVCEGATDAIAASEAGYDAVALYGSRLSRTQRRLLSRLAPAVLLAATDQDRDGHRLAADLAEAFPEIDVRRVMWDVEKDLAEMDLQKRSKVLDSVAQTCVGSASCASNATQRLTRSPASSLSTATQRPRLRLRISA